MNCINITNKIDFQALGHTFQEPVKWCCHQVTHIKDPLNTKGCFVLLEVTQRIILLVGGLVLFIPSLVPFSLGKCFTACVSNSPKNAQTSSAIAKPQIKADEPQTKTDEPQTKTEKRLVAVKPPIDKENLRNNLLLLQKADPHKYPSYLNELLDLDCLHLCKHLIEMKALGTREKRRAESAKMSFSEISHIILEIRIAVTHKVDVFINNHKDCKNIVFLLGGTGAGKSTTLCFLRGDKMEKCGFVYQSKEVKDTIIGHGSSTSCTFFANLQLSNGVLFVDFPGFEDSNGPLVSIGLELVLNALLNKHQSKVLILESITNTDGRNNNLEKLSSRLDRILVSKNNCLLGLTKYSLHPDYNQIKFMEANEKERPNTKKIQLEAQIKALEALIPDHDSDGEITKKLKLVKDELDELNRSTSKMDSQPSKSTEEKKRAELRLELEEQEIIRALRFELKSLIRFAELEDSSSVLKCFEKLSDASTGLVQAQTWLNLDADDQKLLDERFQNDIMPMSYSFKYQNQTKDSDTFIEEVAKSGLIPLISQSSPEIIEFLNMPEIDPEIKVKYDLIFIDKCYQSYLGGVYEILSTKINSRIQNCTLSEITQFKNDFNSLRKILLGLSGNQVTLADSEKFEKAWMELRSRKLNSGERNVKLPHWVADVLKTSLDSPNGIMQLSNDETKITKELMQQCTQELKDMHRAISLLFSLKKTLDERLVKLKSTTN